MSPDQIAVLATEIFGPPIGTSHASKWLRYNGARVHRETGECDLENGSSGVGVPIEVVRDVYKDLGSYSADKYLAELGIEIEEEEEPAELELPATDPSAHSPVEDLPREDAPAPRICIHCHRACERVSAYGGAYMHLECEEPHSRVRFAEEGMPWQSEEFRRAEPPGTSDLTAATALRLQLIQCGHIPVPLFGKEPPIYGKNTKRKGMTGWQKLDNVTPEMVEMWAKTWPGAVNTGALTRPMPTLDFDIENPEAVRDCIDYVRERYEDAGYILERTGKPPRCAVPFRTNEPFKKIVATVISPHGKTEKIEFLSDGQQVVVAGEHPETHRNYSWHGGEPWTIAREDLPYTREVEAQPLVNELVDEVLVRVHGYRRASGEGKTASIPLEPTFTPPSGLEHLDPDEDLAEGLRDKKWWDRLSLEQKDAALDHGLECIAKNSDLLKFGNNEKWYRVVTTVARSGAPHLEDIFVKHAGAVPGADSEEKLRNKLAYYKNNPRVNGSITVGTFIKWAREYGADFTPWLESDDNATTNGVSGPSLNPSAEGGTQQPATVFDPWQPYIVPAFPLDVLPGAVQDFVAQQSEVIGGDMSGMAMATLATFSGAIDHRTQLKMLRNGAWWARPRLWVLLFGDPSTRRTPLMDAATKPLEHHDHRIQQDYRKKLAEYEEAKQDKKEAGEKTSLLQPRPPKRYVIRDITVEMLGEVLARHPKGALAKADELSGWLGSMERYSKGALSDRAFWLKAYDGGPYTVDRIKRGELFIENLSVSLLGGIQPEKLAEMQGLTSDGLLQRFLPVMLGATTFPHDRQVHDEQYGTLVREMFLAPDARQIMTDDALAHMADLRKHLFSLEQASRGLAHGFQSFVGKLHGICGTLALILHLAEDPARRFAEPVEENIIAKVRRLMLNFVLPHAFEFYRSADGSRGDRLRQIASWILTSNAQRIVASDLTRNISELRGLTLPKVQEAVSPLVAAGWLTPTDHTPLCRAWMVAPQVHTQLAERAKTEEAQKAAVATLIGSQRK
jgi:hypothetical protein